MSYHDLTSALKLDINKELIQQLTPNELIAALDAITDVRVRQTQTFREQCFLLCTIMHDFES